MTKLSDFIELGWHTVPLKGELKRLEGGKKTLPKYPKDWNHQFAQNFNKEDTAIGGAITGKVSGIIAIDCDNAITYQMFKALDPTYNYHFVSKGKCDALGNEVESGTIIYQYSDDLADTFKRHDAVISIDFLSNGGFTYVPTDANTTKEPFSFDGIELKEAPEAVVALVKSLKPIKIKRDDTAIAQKSWINHLAPQVKRFTQTKKISPDLFRVLTPRDFRDTQEYLDNNYLEPSQVADGHGSEYLMKISAILGADESIDEELYVNAMLTINDCFSEPMRKVRINSTIIEPMAEERSMIDGVPIWKYDKNWADNKLSFITKRNTLCETFYDPERMLYYAVNVLGQKVKAFGRDSDFVGYIDTIAIEAPSKKEVKSRLPLVNVVSSPAYNFGFFTDKHKELAFNTFTPTLALSIFKEPVNYAKNYSRPTTILKYLESLIPDHYMRNYLLKFTRRKLDKFEYSPVILYFLGVSGAGKDTYVSILESIIGELGMARPSTKVFLETHNGWMLDKYFAQLDEYGNQLSRFDEKDAALGKIKMYTGSAKVQIREMRNDGFNYTHSITFIMTANKNPLFLDHDDRRVALFNCPNKLENESWVQEQGGMTAVHNAMQAEILDFVYYLSTELDNLDADAYMSPPDTHDKKVLIASKFNAAMKISFLLNQKMWVELEDIAREYDQLKLFDGAPEGRLYEEELFDLYYEMTDGKGTKRGLNVAMKEFDKIPTTRNNQKSYYYNVPHLRGFKPQPFSAIEEE